MALVSELPWIAEGRKLIGLTEFAGSANNPEIVQMWKDIKRGGIKDDKTPWCAAFVGACIERVGIRSSRFESAKSYMDWGHALEKPYYGCIAVFTRNGGGHVGFVVGEAKNGNLLILGGNQGDAVNIKEFSQARLSGFRSCPEMVAFGMRPLEVGGSAELSQRES